jgi:hypothetical protein
MQALVPTVAGSAERSRSTRRSAFTRPLAWPSASNQREGDQPDRTPSRRIGCRSYPARTWRSPAALMGGVLTIFVTLWPQHRAEARISDEVKRAMEANAAQLSPITVWWVAKRDCEGSRDEVRARIREEDKQFFEPSYDTYRHDRGKWYGGRRSTFWSKDNGFAGDEWAFDGENLYAGSGRDIKVAYWDPRLDILPLAKARAEGPESRFVEPAYFLNAGFRFPCTPKEFGRSPTPLLLDEIAGGARERPTWEADVEGSKCLVVELIMGSDQHLFFLDPAIRYAVRRRDHRNGKGELTRTVINRDFQALKSGLRLPRSSRVEYYEWNGQRSAKPLFWMDFKTSELHDDPIPIDRFRLDYGTHPGTLVADYARPEAQAAPDKRVVYQIPARRDDLEAVIRQVVTGGTRPYAFRRTTIAVALALLPLIAAILWSVLSKRSLAK